MATTHYPYALGSLLLGIVGLAVGDFALQWQPVPEALPARTALAYLGGALLTLAAGASLIPRIAKAGLLTLAGWYALWVVLLHAPRVIAKPGDIGLWLGVAEISLLAAGGLAGAWLMAGNWRAGRIRTLEVCLAPCLIIFGWSHFAYADFTAQMVPRWIPWPLFWAYATGCGHVAAGLSLLTGIASRLASVVFAGMLGSFVVLLHVPRVIVDPANRIEWTMLAVATSLVGAAWLVALAVRERHELSLEAERPEPGSRDSSASTSS